LLDIIIKRAAVTYITCNYQCSSRVL